MIVTALNIKYTAPSLLNSSTRIENSQFTICPTFIQLGDMAFTPLLKRLVNINKGFTRQRSPGLHVYTSKILHSVVLCVYFAALRLTVVGLHGSSQDSSRVHVGMEGFNFEAGKATRRLEVGIGDADGGVSFEFRGLPARLGRSTCHTSFFVNLGDDFRQSFNGPFKRSHSQSCHSDALPQ